MPLPYIPGHMKNYSLNFKSQFKYPGKSLVVQWLGFCTFTAEGPGLIPGRGTKIPQAAWCCQKKKRKKRYQVPKLLETLSNYPWLTSIFLLKSPNSFCILPLLHFPHSIVITYSCISLPCHNTSSVKVNSMCQLDWAIGCPDIWLNTISGCVCKSVSGWD